MSDREARLLHDGRCIMYGCKLLLQRVLKLWHIAARPWCIFHLLKSSGRRRGFAENTHVSFLSRSHAARRWFWFFWMDELKNTCIHLVNFKNLSAEKKRQKYGGTSSIEQLLNIVSIELAANWVIRLDTVPKGDSPKTRLYQTDQTKHWTKRRWLKHKKKTRKHKTKRTRKINSICKCFKTSPECGSLAGLLLLLVFHSRKPFTKQQWKRNSGDKLFSHSCEIHLHDSSRRTRPQNSFLVTENPPRDFITHGDNILC